MEAAAAGAASAPCSTLTMRSTASLSLGSTSQARKCAREPRAAARTLGAGSYRAASRRGARKCALKAAREKSHTAALAASTMRLRRQAGPRRELREGTPPPKHRDISWGRVWEAKKVTAVAKGRARGAVGVLVLRGITRAAPPPPAPLPLLLPLPALAGGAPPAKPATLISAPPSCSCRARALKMLEERHSPASARMRAVGPCLWYHTTVCTAPERTCLPPSLMRPQARDRAASRTLGEGKRRGRVRSAASMESCRRQEVLAG